LSATVDPNVAATKMPAVAALIRLSVNQLWCCACSHDLAPLAPAIAAIAHAAHMDERYRRCLNGSGSAGHAFTTQSHVMAGDIEVGSLG
jgi:hypothetical protein